MRFAKSQYKGRDLIVLAHDKQVHTVESEKTGNKITRHYLDIQVKHGNCFGCRVFCCFIGRFMVSLSYKIKGQRT